MARGLDVLIIAGRKLHSCPESVVHAGQDTNRSCIAAEETASRTGGSGGGNHNPITRAEVVIIAFDEG